MSEVDSRGQEKISLSSPGSDANNPTRNLNLIGDPRGVILREDTIGLRKKHISDACTVFFNEDPLKIVRSRAQYLYDENGVEYLDCINNVAHGAPIPIQIFEIQYHVDHGVFVAVGHCHPRVVAATAAQLATQCTNSRYLNDMMVLCAQRIAKTMPDKLSVVFFVNSGSEANDLAIRLARHYTGNKDVVILDHAYHGHTDTVTDISPHKFHHIKNYRVKNWVHVAPQPDSYRGMYRSGKHTDEDLGPLYAAEVDKMIKEATKRGRGISLFLVESQQSCAGQVLLPHNFLKPAYEAVRNAGGLCLADEVQTGFGRMGTHYWSFEEQGVVPDFVTIGKAMGNGFPVAALVTTREIANVLVDVGIEYFNTYGGNAVSCITALAVMDVIEEEGLMEHAKVVGAYLLEKFQWLKDRHHKIGDVRGRGLFLGIEIVKSRNDEPDRQPDKLFARDVIRRMKERHIILSVEGPQDNVIKVKPPMCFTKENADHMVRHLDEVLSEMESELKPVFESAAPVFKPAATGEP